MTHIISFILSHLSIRSLDITLTKVEGKIF